MKIAVVLNGIARSKKFVLREYLPALKSHWHTDLFETGYAGEAKQLTTKIIEDDYDIILSAGGDGTLSQVVNGILACQSGGESIPVVGVIPAGSGNDFARSLNIPLSAQHLIRLITAFNPSHIDVGKISFGGGQEKDVHYFINEADIGMGPEVVQRVMKSRSYLGAGVSYYFAILSTFKSFNPFLVTASSTSWNWQGKIRTLAVANGKYYGHGLCIAPTAEVNDGNFSVFIAGDVSVLDFIRCSGKLKRGETIVLPKVHYKEAVSISLDAIGSQVIEADGELAGNLPVTISLCHHVLRFLY